MLEFAVPRGLWRPLWDLWVRVGLPGAGRVISPGWHEVGRFLGPSIRGFWAHYDIAVLFRSGYMSFDLEVELQRANIPFQKFGGMKFIEIEGTRYAWRDILQMVATSAKPLASRSRHSSS